MTSDLSVCQELEDVPTQRQGHDLGVQETQSDHAPHVPIGTEPTGGLGASGRGARSVVTRLARLVEERWLCMGTEKKKGLIDYLYQ